MKNKPKSKNKPQAKPQKPPKVSKDSPETQATPPQVPLDTAPVAPPAPPEAQTTDDPEVLSLGVRLQQRYEVLRHRADILLEEADRDQSFDRSLRLEQFLDRLRARLQELEPSLGASLNNPQASRSAETSPPLDELSLKELQKRAKEQRLRGYSRLTKQELIRKLS
jgi:hypothetical protein